MSIQERIESMNGYHDKSTELILQEAEKSLSETVASFRHLTNASFIAFTFYATLAAHWINKLQSAKDQYSIVLYVFMLIGNSIALYYVYKNVFPRHLVLEGVQPENMLDPYFTFENPDEDTQIKRYKHWKIAATEQSILTNSNINKKRVKNFKIAIKTGFAIGIVFVAQVICHQVFQCWVS